MTKQEDQILYQQRALEKEVDDDLQNQRFKDFWNKYKYILIGAVVFSFIAICGMEIYKAHQQKKSLAESHLFEKASIQTFQGKHSKAMEDLKKLQEESNTYYKNLAQFKEAEILLKEGKTSEAILKLQNLQKYKEFKDIALLMEVGHSVDTADADVLLNKLNPLLKPSNPYFYSAVELKTLLLLKKNEALNAKNFILSLLNTTTDTVAKARLEGLLTLIGE